MKLVLSATWSSAHLYHQQRWTKAQNLAAFGKCYSEYGHGHDYQIEVEWILSDLNEIRGLQHKLKAILTETIDTLDHHHLNFVIAEFKDKIPTTENIALYCQNLLDTKLVLKKLPKVKSLRLYERPDLWVELHS